MLLLYRSASRSGGCYFSDSKAATDFYKAAEYYHTKQPEFHSGGVTVTKELNVAVVHEKEVEAAAVPTAVVNGGPPPPPGNNENDGGGGGDRVMFSDEFMMPPDYLVSSHATDGRTGKLPCPLAVEIFHPIFPCMA